MAKIAELHVYRCALPVARPPYRMALAEVTALDTTLVEIVTDTGLVGYGETCPLGPTYQPAHAAGARAALSELAPAMLGLDPLLTVGQRVRAQWYQRDPADPSGFGDSLTNGVNRIWIDDLHLLPQNNFAGQS